MTTETRTRSFLFTSILACGSLSFGLPVGLSGPLASLKPLNLCLPPEFQGDVKSFTLFSSILNIGAMFGAVSGGVIADKLGRRGAFIVACIVSIIGSCGIIFGSAMWVLNAGRCVSSCFRHVPVFKDSCRFVNGFSVGLFSLLVPMYISEIAPTSLRGLMGTCHALGITVGITIAIALGLPIADNLEWWRYVAAISTTPTLVLLLGFIFYVPETPRWLLAHGRVPEALAALKRLRGSTFNADAEMRQLQHAQLAIAGQSGPSSLMQQFKVLLSLQYRRPILIALGLQLTQQATGINGVLFFLGDLFSGASPTCNSDEVRNAIRYSILGGCINVVGTIFSLFITEKAGRRLLLSSSLAGMGGFLAMGGCAIWFGWASVAQKVAVLVYIFCFAFGCGPVPWVMMSEVMPSRIRGPAMSLGTLSNWLLCGPLSLSHELFIKCAAI
jgi:SP family sugar porter-like MFS transporter